MADETRGRAGGPRRAWTGRSLGGAALALVVTAAPAADPSLAGGWALGPFGPGPPRPGGFPDVLPPPPMPCRIVTRPGGLPVAPTPVTVRGAERVPPLELLRLTGLDGGGPLTPARLERACAAMDADGRFARALLETDGQDRAAMSVTEEDPFGAGLSLRTARGLYELDGRFSYRNTRLLGGYAGFFADALVGLATARIDDLEPGGPVFDAGARLAIFELGLPAGHLEVRVDGSRTLQTDYVFTRGTATLGYGVRVRSWLRVGGSLSAEIGHVSGPEVPRLAGEDEAVCEVCVVSALTQSVAVDRTNEPRAPTRGVRGRLDLAEAGPPLGSDYGFVRASPEVAVFVPLASAVTFAGRLRLGALAGDAPLYQRFFAGGATSVRSFGYNRLSPYARAAGGEVVPVGGRALAVANAEIRIAIPVAEGSPIEPSVAAFADAGRVTVDLDDLPGEPAVAIGGGLRAETPVGPARLDAGFSVRRPPLPTVGPDVAPPDLPDWALHFTFGEPF